MLDTVSCSISLLIIENRKPSQTPNGKKINRDSEPFFPLRHSSSNVILSFLGVRLQWSPVFCNFKGKKLPEQQLL